ncbi:phosphatase PAP2 family protein [Curvibacter sp. CHRR-16]|uniref:phosphatase PAP2 family protein n=1 Tax=Curvibacter sp. CHRR-16 TaxID=2835872 RepID=UPI001BDAE400|nr:phosphatase PAP2 family protein [Curvibacter sp. CHRR-16]MBT0571560.1 phosphatase PAP2 family protein [Curvibacter sp. CHRR-16]
MRLPSPLPPQSRLAFLVLLAASLVAAGALYAFPQWDLAAASVFADPSPRIASAQWWWVQAINDWAPFVFRVFLGLCFVVWLLSFWRAAWRRWRLPLIFIVLSGILGPGLMVGVVKEQFNRARPYQVQEFGGTARFTRAAQVSDQCDVNCSFVSGHVACGFFFSTLLLVLPHQRKRWLLLGTAAGLVIGFARMSAMGHWLSDVLWAYPVTLLSSWLVWWLLQFWFQRSTASAQPSTTVG